MRSTLCVIATSMEPLGLVLDRYHAADALLEGRAFVNGCRAIDPSQCLELGARVEVYPARAHVNDVSILAERAGLVFVEKPAGLATEPDRRGTTEALSTRVAQALGIPTDRVSALSRLDVGVSGVVIFGIAPEARQRLAKLREQGLVRRRYVAIAAHSPVPRAGLWDDAIARRHRSPTRSAGADGQPAQTRYRTVGAATASGAVVLSLEPLTGRTHQLRLHASTHGAPFFGDRAYRGPARVVLADGSVLGFERVLLHAAWVELPDELRIVSAVPVELSDIWRALDGEANALTRAVEEPVDE